MQFNLKKPNYKVVFASLVIISSAVFIYFIKPDASSVYPPCPFKSITGYLCPGCGSLRSSFHLLHGNFSEAMELNSLVVLIFPFMIYSFISFLLKEIFGVKTKPVFIKPGLIWLLLASIIFFGLARNINLNNFI